MNSRNHLKIVALASVLVLLAACVTQPTPLLADATSLDTPLEHCEQITGTRIRVKDRGDCTPLGYPFKSFSARELQATGEIDLVEALRLLDPAFQ